MKKIIACFIFYLLAFNISYAEQALTVNGLLESGYIITKEETIKGEGSRLIKVLTLKKGKKSFAICTISISYSTGPRASNCKLS